MKVNFPGKCFQNQCVKTFVKVSLQCSSIVVKVPYYPIQKWLFIQVVQVYIYWRIYILVLQLKIGHKFSPHQNVSFHPNMRLSVLHNVDVLFQFQPRSHGASFDEWGTESNEYRPFCSVVLGRACFINLRVMDARSLAGVL